MCSLRRSAQISADSKRVVYRADQDVDGTREIFSVPISGGAVTQLNDELPFSSNAGTFSLSSNGEFMVYIADQDVFDEFEVFAHRLAIKAGTNDDFCFPIISSNRNVAVVCL